MEGRDAEPLQCALVTAGGALLTGGLGAPLQAAGKGVASAAWSGDGALLAFAQQECVTVRDAASGRSFTTRIMSGVRLCTRNALRLCKRGAAILAMRAA